MLSTCGPKEPVMTAKKTPWMHPWLSVSDILAQLVSAYNLLLITCVFLIFRYCLSCACLLDIMRQSHIQPPLIENL